MCTLTRVAAVRTELRRITLLGVIIAMAPSPAHAQRGGLARVDSSRRSLAASEFAIASALVTQFRASPKGEFETTEAYRNRMSARLDAHLYAVRINASAEAPYDCVAGSIEYDADAGEFKYALPEA